MDTWRQYWQKIQEYIGIAPPRAMDAAVPTPPSAQAIGLGRAKVEAASASMMNADQEYSTVTAVMHRDGQVYLVGSAHATNKRFSVSKGFDMDGRTLFPIVKGNQVALAEHIAVNPQGSVCDVVGNFNSRESFQDISILKLLNPQETATILHAWLKRRDAGTRIKKALSTYPDLAFNRIVMPATETELDTKTKDFSLTPLDFVSPQYGNATTEVYSLAYHDNRPHPVRSELSQGEKHNGVKVKFRCDNPMMAGHSGSLLFRVTHQGGIVPLGIVSVTDGVSLVAFATPYREVANGLDALSGGKVTTQHISIDAICRNALTSNAWFSPTAIQASSAVAPPAGASGKIKHVAPKCR